MLWPIWLTKTVTADDLRRVLSEGLDFTTVNGHRTGPNSARWEGNLSMVLPASTSATGEEDHPAQQLKNAQRF